MKGAAMVACCRRYALGCRAEPSSSIFPRNMSFRSKLSLQLLKCLPSRLRHIWIRFRAPVMVDLLGGLGLSLDEEAIFSGQKFYGIRLGRSVRLLGEEAGLREALMFSWLAEKRGLSRGHARVLLDAGARFLYPHMAGAWQRMPGAVGKRRFFHPQHTNLAAEDEKLDEATRGELERVFRPQPGWRVIDVGSYLGHGALWMAGEVGPEGRVVCVEAKALNVEVIREHILRNGFSEVMDVRYNAIWHTAGEKVRFNVTGRQGNAIDSEVVEGDQVEVETISLPALIADLGMAPQLVSLTVNGAEVEAVEGLQGLAPENLPERVIAPGWYLKGGEPRWKVIEPSLKKLGYRVAVTSGGCVFGWRV